MKKTIIPAAMSKSSAKRPAPRVTMQDIANRCGVSRATVGRALSPQPLEVDPATVEHIRAVAVEMGYRHARGSFDKTIPPSPSPVVTFSVTQKDIAKRCGVSYTTVQRVLQHNGRSVRPEIAERIRTVIAEMGYDPETNHFARKMRSRGHRLPVLNHAVALLNRLGSLLELYGYHVERGIADVLNKAGFDLIIGWNQQRPPWQFPRPLLRGDVDGVLFTAAADFIPNVLRQLHAVSGFGHRPVVVYLNNAQGCSSVNADDVTGGYLLVDHLLQLGHRRILHFSEGTISTLIQQRLAGYQQACRDHGVNPEQVLISVKCVGEEKEADFATLLRDTLARHTDITAMLAMNDGEVPFIWRWLHDKGLRVPEDISLVGFDDVGSLLNERHENILTTIQVPLEEIGRQATTLLLDMIAGKVTEETHMILPVKLIVRQSTAPPRATRALTVS